MRNRRATARDTPRSGELSEQFDRATGAQTSSKELTWSHAALITAVVTGRLALTWACRRGVAAARPDGLGALVAGSVGPAIPAVATLATLAAAVAAVVVSATVVGEPLGWTLPLAVVAGLGASFVVQRHAVRRLGGITGDVLGALAEVATTVTLVVAAMGPPA